LYVIALSIPLAVIVSLPIGIYISNRPILTKIVLTIAGVLMTIPSLALFGIMVILLAPLNMGIGIAPAVVAIIIYSLLPIIRNTVTAILQVSPDIIEAAIGMGLSESQILFKIKMPLSIGIIMSGVRNAIVLGISVTAFACLVGAGGLGYFIFSGIARSNFYMIVTGALLISFLGIFTNFIFLKIEKWLTPKGLQLAKE
jgi:osmoprotectant transport system permease protein